MKLTYRKYVDKICSRSGDTREYIKHPICKVDEWITPTGIDCISVRDLQNYGTSQTKM